MTVGIVGLGLIGGSLAKAVKANTDYRVFGCDVDDAVVQKAISQGAADEILSGKNLSLCDLMLIALYPDGVISYCRENFKHMKPGTIVVDCAGVKSSVCKELPGLADGYGLQFVGGHPMAGIERSGFDNSYAELFANAAMILCRDGVKDERTLEKLSAFFLKLGFGSIKLTAAEEHDGVIAYTSQLAHLVSSAYVKGGTRAARYGFSAGSFKDMTRVARLNENMWTELFLENKENLLKETDEFIENVLEYRRILASGSECELKELLRNGSAIKIADEAEEKKRADANCIESGKVSESNQLNTNAAIKAANIAINTFSSDGYQISKAVQSETVTVNTRSSQYQVTIGQELSYGALAAKVKKPCKLVIVSDDNVFPLYGKAAAESFRTHGFQVSSFVFKHGEASKNLSTAENLLSFLAEEHITRSDMLAALGGGVVGDLTGFAASIYLRGISFIQLPTTVLAAVDSSVGGKTGVDLPAGKNLAGAFYQPLAVFCDVNTFKTLPPEVYADGMAEIIKHAMIADGEMLARLKELPPVELIRRNVQIKARVVERDEFDTGLRRLLNFGHTVGHAVETLSGYKISHGSAVAIGMAVITRAAERMGLTEEPCLEALTDALAAFGLPIRCDFGAKELAEAALQDKKRLGGRIALVVPKRVGEAAVWETEVEELERIVSKGMRYTASRHKQSPITSF